VEETTYFIHNEVTDELGANSDSDLDTNNCDDSKSVVKKGVH
jgi:hypothetical protein